ncbi:MAG TPA: ATP-binding protein [Bryobacteraceae bacterium]|nr:ATP-binding protein [Bryobacteraceae bacterium]
MSLRSVLIAGFGGMALIFLFSTVESVRLLGVMRAENRILRQASLERSNHLDSIRSTVLLTRTYLGDFLLDSDPTKSKDHLTQIEQAWSHLSSDLSTYHSATLDEQVLIKQLEDQLNRHWRYMDRAMNSAPGGRSATSFYSEQVLPLSTSIVEITSQLEGIDAKQAASTEAQIEDSFEQRSARLSLLLGAGLGAALLLAAGCLFYIFRIERENNRRYEEVLSARGSLEQLSARLVNAQEMERRTISRELHDQVGQTLNAVLVEAANLAKRIPADDSASLHSLDNIRKFADSSVNSIRDIALLLRPSMLDDLGLIPALEWQAREVSRRSGIKVEVKAENVADSLPDEMRTCIYRVVQEALQNVSRHSSAKSALVTVRQNRDSLELSVEDDGSGFDPAKTRGLGMLGMEERVRQLGGHLDVSSTPGKGTVLRVTLPVPVTG